MLPQPGKLCPQLPHRSWVFHFLTLIYCGWAPCLSPSGNLWMAFVLHPSGLERVPVMVCVASTFPECILPTATWNQSHCFLTSPLKARVQEKGTRVSLCHYTRVCASLAYRRCSTEHRFGALLPGPPTPERPRYYAPVKAALADLQWAVNMRARKQQSCLVSTTLT